MNCHKQTLLFTHYIVLELKILLKSCDLILDTIYNMSVSDVSLIQPLSKRWANGDVIGYRIRISIYTEFNTSDPGQTSTDSANLLVNSGSYLMQNIVQRSHKEVTINETVTSTTFYVEEDSSHWVTVEARTSAGFNESLHPEKVIIPSKNNGSLSDAVTW